MLSGMGFRLQVLAAYNRHKADGKGSDNIERSQAGHLPLEEHDPPTSSASPQPEAGKLSPWLSQTSPSKHNRLQPNELMLLTGGSSCSGILSTNAAQPNQYAAKCA